MKILHFADAHIDMANYGRHDPVTGLPLRVLDFLKSLDAIVDAAIREKVELVIFAGDAYKDRSPGPTYPLFCWSATMISRRPSDVLMPSMSSTRSRFRGSRCFRDPASCGQSR